STATTEAPTKTAVEAEIMVAGSVSSPPRSAMTALATAPRTAAPRAWPTERANMLAPVTTPRSSQPTLDCAAMRAGTDANPNPSPITNDTIATVTIEGAGPNAASAAVPSTTSTAPRIEVERKPNRR